MGRDSCVEVTQGDTGPSPLRARLLWGQNGKNSGSNGLDRGMAWPSQVALVVKNLPGNAGGIRETGWIPGLERSPGRGNADDTSTLAWRIPWTEEPGRLQCMRSQRVRHD